MMLLAIETATETASAALLDGESLRATLAFRAHRDVCRRLLPQIEQMMQQSGVSTEALSAIAVGRGPGSFTGIRIGVSMAKGLALALNAPVFGISTLTACAYPAAGAGGIACAVIPAHGLELYAGIFRAEAALIPVEEGVWQASDIMKRLSRFGGKVTFAPVNAQARDLLPVHELTVEHAFLPNDPGWNLAYGVGRLAQARLASGDPGDGIGLAPVYLRPSQAEMQAGALREGEP